MWILKRPDDLLKYYEYDENEVVLGNFKHIAELYQDTVLIPYRFGMSLHDIKNSLAMLEDEIDVLFYIDRLSVSDSDGNALQLPIPQEIFSRWFLKDTAIETHDNKLVFIDSCPHSWDGIDKVSIITVDILNNLWCQQHWGEQGFIKDFLQVTKELSVDSAEDWGNAPILLEMNDEGSVLKISSTNGAGDLITVQCKWDDSKWVVSN